MGASSEARSTCTCRRAAHALTFNFLPKAVRCCLSALGSTTPAVANPCHIFIGNLHVALTSQNRNFK